MVKESLWDTKKCILENGIERLTGKEPILGIMEIRMKARFLKTKDRVMGNTPGEMEQQ